MSQGDQISCGSKPYSTLFCPQTQQPAWDVDAGFWRAVRPIRPKPVSLHDIITGNRILAQPMEN